MKKIKELFSTSNIANFQKLALFLFFIVGGGAALLAMIGFAIIWIAEHVRIV